MQTQPFSNEAEQRLEAIYPGEGAARFRRLSDFVGVAAKYVGTAFVVPPDVDPDLHEVLAARDSRGRGFEQIVFSHIVKEPMKISHIAKSSFGLAHPLKADAPASVGKTFGELEDPDAGATRERLEANGFNMNEVAIYAQPACTLTVLQAA